jgi:hypothetical protein
MIPYIVPRMIRKLGVVLILFILGTLFQSASCIFGPNRYYGVMSHRGNRVFIRHDRWYRVGKLPEDWENLKVKVRAAAWYNPAYRSTISTDVLCEVSAGDRSLGVVAGEVSAAMDNRIVTDTKKFTLDERGALREHVTGSVDGVPLEMDIVVLKKNNCAFNMVAITPPDQMLGVKPIFEEFFAGFHYE